MDMTRETVRKQPFIHKQRLYQQVVKMNTDQKNFIDLIDRKNLKDLFEKFSAATGFTIGLVDQSTNEILLQTGWRDICVKFHRACPDSQQHCRHSNKKLTSGAKDVGEIRIRQCENGLIDGCTPIFLAGKHVASLYTGQILFAQPDRERFRRQAQKYGYDEKAYLASLADVPVISEEQFTNMLHYLAQMASMIVEMSRASCDSSNESTDKEALLQSIFRSAPVGIGVVVDRVIQWTNDRMSELTGYSRAELAGQEARILYLNDEEFAWVGQEKYKQIQDHGTGSVETHFKRKDGSIIDIQLSSTPIDPSNLSLGVTFTALDITERKKSLTAIKNNEQRLQLVMEGADLGMWDWNIQSNEIYFSPRYFTMLDYSPTELPHTLATWMDLIHPDERKLVRQQISSIIKSRSGQWSQEFRMRTKSGDYRWILGRGKVVEFSPEGLPLRAAGTHLDINHNKEIVRNLHDREERFREIFNNMSSGVAIYAAVDAGQDFVFKDINKAGLVSSKSELHELLGRKVTDVFPSLKDMGLLKVFQRVWQTGIPEHFPATFYLDDRVTFWVKNYVCKIPSGEIVAIYDDITEQKTTEKEIIRAKSEWERTFDAIPDIVTIQDSNLNIIRANRAACTALDSTFNAVIDHHCYELFRGSKEPCPDCPLLKTKRDFHSYSREMYHEKLGKTYLVSAAPVFDKQGELEYIAHVAKDISALKKLEEDRVRLAAAIDQASETVIITDSAGTIQYVNPAFERLTGYSRVEVLGQTPRILASGKQKPLFYTSMWATLRQGKVWRGHLTNRKKDGSLFKEEGTISPVLDSDGKISNFVAVKRDVSREVSLEKQLRQAMKMEAIGTLAGGIAHDFNNILAAILGYGEMARNQLAGDDPVRRDLDQIILAGTRAADLVQQILTFSRQGEDDFRPLKVQFIVKEVLKLLRSSLPATIELKETIALDSGPVSADPSQIHQVLMNLCTNAKHALGDDGGTLTVSLTEIEVTDSHPVGDCPQLLPGTYLDLKVGDTGYGIDEMTQLKIFDPFFTTKEKGEGTGLGLSVVHGIVKQHKGEITVTGKPDQGSTFHVYLPVINAEIDISEIVVEKIVGGRERILLVDDELALTDMLERMISRLGYTVTVFNSSMEALVWFQKNPDNVDLVITDMTMPKMTGVDMAINLLALRPELPVVLCTGFSEIVDESRAKSLGICEYVMKPVDKQTIAKAIRSALQPA